MVDIGNAAQAGETNRRTLPGLGRFGALARPRALPPLSTLPDADWLALAECTAEPNGYYLPDWELAVNATARGRTGVSALRLAAFRPRQPILAYSRVRETTRRLGLAHGVTPIDLDLPVGNDPIGVTLTAARRDLPPGTRIVLLDISTTPGVPSLVNAITL